MELKHKLLSFRAENNLTQVEFADKLNLTRDIIMRAEQGKPIRAINKRKIEMYIENNK